VTFEVFGVVCLLAGEKKGRRSPNRQISQFFGVPIEGGEGAISYYIARMPIPLLSNFSTGRNKYRSQVVVVDCEGDQNY
jgi:hypothetical protein